MSRPDWWGPREPPHVRRRGLPSRLGGQSRRRPRHGRGPWHRDCPRSPGRLPRSASLRGRKRNARSRGHPPPALHRNRRALAGVGPAGCCSPAPAVAGQPPAFHGGRRLRCARGPLRGWGPRSPLRRRPRPGAGPPRPAKSRQGSSAGGSGRACARLLSVSLPALCPPLRRRGRGNGDSAACGRRGRCAPGVSIPPPDPSYDQRKGCGPSFGNLPGGYDGFSEGRELEALVPAVIPSTPPCGRRGR